MVPIPEHKPVEKLGEREVGERIAAIFDRRPAGQMAGEERHRGVKVVQEALHLPEQAPLGAGEQRIAALRVVRTPLLNSAGGNANFFFYRVSDAHTFYADPDYGGKLPTKTTSSFTFKSLNFIMLNPDQHIRSGSGSNECGSMWAHWDPKHCFSQLTTPYICTRYLPNLNMYLTNINMYVPTAPTYVPTASTYAPSASTYVPTTPT